MLCLTIILVPAGRLQQLRVLDLSRNEIRKLPRQLPEHCVLLRQFHLHANPPMVGLPLTLPNLDLLTDFTYEPVHVRRHCFVPVFHLRSRFSVHWQSRPTAAASAGESFIACRAHLKLNVPARPSCRSPSLFKLLYDIQVVCVVVHRCDDRHLDPVFYAAFKDIAGDRVSKLFEFVGRFKENKSPGRKAKK